MLRKHINSMSDSELASMPFYSWNCLTLSLDHRDVELVVRDESDMNQILKYLIHRLRTLDGTRGTAEKIIELMNKQSLADLKKEVGRDVISKTKEHQLIQQNEQAVFRKVLMKYKIMRIRSKISFIALQKSMTVVELIIDSIIRTYHERVADGLIFVGPTLAALQDDVYMTMIRGDTGVLKRLVHMRAQEDVNLLTESRCLKAKLENTKKKQEDVQVIKVIKDGVAKNFKINFDRNKTKEKEIVKILEKEQCLDIFKDAVVDKKTELFKDSNHQQFIKYKFKRKGREIQYNKIKLFMNMKLIGGIVYCKALLKRIQIAKELFVLEIEQGQEVLIPSDLSQDALPMSFRYYDSILRIVQSRVQLEKRELLRIQQNLSKNLHKFSPFEVFKRKIGLTDVQEKLFIKHSVVNYKQRKEIDLQQSEHTMNLQRSNYIQIDQGMSKSAVSADRKEDDVARAYLSLTGYPHAHGKKLDQLESCIPLKYMKMKEINAKRQMFLKFKQQFMIKQEHLKILGKKETLSHQVDQWLMANLESLKTLQVINHIKEQHHQQEKELKKRKGIHSDSCTSCISPELYNKKVLELFSKEAEKIIKANTLRKRKHTIDRLKSRCKPSENYQKKEDYVDKNIERNIRYFAIDKKEHAKFKTIMNQIKMADRKIASRQLSKSLSLQNVTSPMTSPALTMSARVFNEAKFNQVINEVESNASLSKSSDHLNQTRKINTLNTSNLSLSQHSNKLYTLDAIREHSDEEAPASPEVRNRVRPKEGKFKL